MYPYSGREVLTKDLIENHEDLARELFLTICSPNIQKTVDQYFLQKLKLALEKNIIKITFEDLRNAMINGHFEILEVMYSSMTDYQKTMVYDCDTSKKTLLHILATKGSETEWMDDELLEKIVNLLLKNQVRINVLDSAKRTAINYALIKKNHRLFKILINKNFNKSDDLDFPTNCYVSSPIVGDKTLMDDLQLILRENNSEEIYKNYFSLLMKCGILIVSPFKYGLPNEDKKINFLVEFLNSDFVRDKLASKEGSESYAEIEELIRALLNNHLNSPLLSALIGENDEDLRAPFRGKKKDFITYLKTKNFFDVVKSPQLKNIIRNELDNGRARYSKLVKSIEDGSQIERQFYMPESLYIKYNQQAKNFDISSIGSEYLERGDYANFLKIVSFGYDLNYIDQYITSLSFEISKEEERLGILNAYAMKIFFNKLLEKGFLPYIHYPVLKKHFSQLTESMPDLPIKFGFVVGLLQKNHNLFFDKYLLDNYPSDVLTIYHKIRSGFNLLSIASNAILNPEEFKNFIDRNIPFFLSKSNKTCLDFFLDFDANQLKSKKEALQLFLKFDSAMTKMEAEGKPVKGFTLSFLGADDKIVKVIPKLGIADYCGDMVDFIPNGFGKVVFEDGSSYVGEFKNGLFHNKGQITYKVGDVYHTKKAVFWQGKFINSNGELEDILCKDSIEGEEDQGAYVYRIDPDQAIKIVADIDDVAGIELPKEDNLQAVFNQDLFEGDKPKISELDVSESIQPSSDFCDKIEYVQDFLSTKISQIIENKIEEIIFQSQEFLLFHTDFINLIKASVKQSDEHLQELQARKRAMEIQKLPIDEDIDKQIELALTNKLKSGNLVVRMTKHEDVKKIVSHLKKKIKYGENELLLAELNDFKEFIKVLTKAVKFNPHYLSRAKSGFLTFDKKALYEDMKAQMRIEQDLPPEQIKLKEKKLQFQLSLLEQLDIQPLVDLLNENDGKIISQIFAKQRLTKAQEDLIALSLKTFMSKFSFEKSLFVQSQIEDLEISISSMYDIFKANYETKKVKKIKSSPAPVLQDSESQVVYKFPVKSVIESSTKDAQPSAQVAPKSLLLQEESIFKEYFLGLRAIKIESKKLREISFKSYDDFTFGCGYFISFDQLNYLQGFLAEEFKKVEFKKSYADYCRQNGFSEVRTTNNYLKHYFHKKIDDLVGVFVKKNRHFNHGEIRNSVYFFLAFCLAKNKSQLEPFINDFERSYGLGHASNSNNSDLLKLIFLVDNLQQVNEQNQGHNIYQQLRDLRQSCKDGNIELLVQQDKNKIFEDKIIDIENKDYLQNLIEGIVIHKIPHDKTSKTKDFCMLYCYFLDAIYQEDLVSGGQKIIDESSVKIFESLNNFLKTTDSNEKIFDFLNDQKELLAIISYLGSSNFVSRIKYGFDAFECLVNAFDKLSISKSNSEDSDFSEVKIANLKTILNALTKDNDLLEIKDLRQQNKEIFTTSSRLKLAQDRQL